MMDVVMLAMGALFFALSIAYVSPAICFEGHVMVFDYWLAASVIAGLLVYLTYALLKPEQF